MQSVESLPTGGCMFQVIKTKTKNQKKSRQEST